jgi:hypothetical protein
MYRLGVYSFRRHNAACMLRRVEMTAMWLINLGLRAFLASEPTTHPVVLQCLHVRLRGFHAGQRAQRAGKGFDRE